MYFGHTYSFGFLNSSVMTMAEMLPLHVLMNRRRFDNALIASHQLRPSTPPFPGNVSISIRSIRSTHDVRFADRFAILLDLLGIGFEPQAVFAVEVTTVWYLVVVC